MKCSNDRIESERRLAGGRGLRGGRTRVGLRGLVVLMMGFLLGWTGCDRAMQAERDENGAEIKRDEHGISYNATAAREMDVSGILEAPTEKNALKAYFKGKKFLSMAYFAKDEARAKQYSAEAERWFERSLRFYVPDIEAMVAGKKPVHASANWEFLKGLHEAWSESIKLSGKRLASKEYVDKNVKDAWALSVISRMIQDEQNEERRRELIAGKFPEVREILEGSDKYAAQVAAKKDALGKKRAQAAQTVVSQGRPAKPSKPTPSMTLLAKADISPSKVGLDKGLVAEDPLTRRAAFASKTLSNQTATAAPVAKSDEPAKPEVRVAAAQPDLTVKKESRPSSGPASSDGGRVRLEGLKRPETPAEFRQFSPSTPRIYVGDRLHTLPATPGKLYIGDRIHILPPAER